MAKTLIVKLGYSETLDKEISHESSLGDVLRTTVILPVFKDTKVTWLVDSSAYPLLDGNPYIDRVLPYNLESVLQLESEQFDTVINFEKVPGIAALADKISAWRRYGFRFDRLTGRAQAYDGAEMVFSICNNDALKKKNKKHWQQALIEMVGGEWADQEYVLGYKPKTVEKHDLGFNWAVGKKWPNKAWPEAKWKELEKLVAGKYSVSWQQGLSSLFDYMDWINSCRCIITSDSLGLHLALALKKKVIVLYGPTHSAETYLYGRGVEIFPPEKLECMPCLKPSCNRPKSCMEAIQCEKVLSTVQKLMS